MKPVLSLLIVILFSGCASTVKPWEKGYLAKPEMALDPDPAESRVDRHVRQAKEAAFGGYGVGGGGCGCN